MRILHIVEHVQPLGNGIVHVAIDLACQQAADGHQVAVASEGGSFERLLADRGIRHFPFPTEVEVGPMLRALWALRRINTEFRPDVLHAHVAQAALLAWMLRPIGQYATVGTVHNEFERNAVLMGLGQRTIAVSEAVATSLRRRRVPAWKLRVVRNGTVGSCRSGPASDHQPAALERPSLVTVAGMFRRKGISDLIDAFAKLADQAPGTQLYLVGNGPDRAEFEAQAALSSVRERIHFEGFTPDPLSYMRSADVFVLASHSEPFGLVLVEAREAGCAIVATDVDGCAEALDGGQAGVMVPPGDVDALASACLELLLDDDLRRRWQVRGGQNLEYYTVARMHEDTMRVYRELRPQA